MFLLQKKKKKKHLGIKEIRSTDALHCGCLFTLQHYGMEQIIGKATKHQPARYPPTCLQDIMVKLKLIVDLQLPTIIQNLGRLRPVVHFMLYSMWVLLEKHKCTMTWGGRRGKKKGRGWGTAGSFHDTVKGSRITKLLGCFCNENVLTVVLGLDPSKKKKTSSTESNEKTSKLDHIQRD